MSESERVVRFLTARVDELAVLVDTLAADAERTERRLEALEGEPVERVPRWEFRQVLKWADGAEDRLSALEARLAPIKVTLDGKPIPTLLADAAPVPPGCPACDGVAGTECRCDSHGPVPQWRQKVDREHEQIEANIADGWSAPDPLAYALECLASIDRGVSVAVNLAYIVALCERELGDGWLADPDLIEHHGDGGVCDMDCLLDALAMGGVARWIALAGRGASWLRSITEDAS